jgi:hypothetical protein
LRGHGDPLVGVLKESIDMLAAIDALQTRMSGKHP